MMAMIEKFPLKIALVLYVALLWTRFDGFESDPASPIVLKKAELAQAETSKIEVTEKVKAAREFFRGLEAKRAEVQALARELVDMKSVLPESMDTGGFIKTVITEATRVGLRVLSIKPKEMKKEEYYAEQTFELTYTGVYAQLVVLFERLNAMASIVRIDDFSLRREGSAVVPYVEVGGSMLLKAYKYVGSKADEVAKAASGTPLKPPSPVQSTPAQPATEAPAAAPEAPAQSAPAAPAQPVPQETEEAQP